MIAIFPELVAASAKGDMERLAILARRYFGGNETFAPKPDVKALLISVGVEVETLPLDTQGALVAKDEKGVFQIVAIAKDSPSAAENRFLLAHMLGHVLLDIMPAVARGDWQVSGYREAVCPMKRYAQGGLDRPRTPADVREEAADKFAAALLMPIGMVRRAEESFKDLEKTALFFGVPRAVLERRLQDLGIITPAPVNFLDAEKRIGAAERPTAPEPAPLSAPEPSMPRSYAASTYGQTERTTRREAKGGSGEGAKAPRPKAPTAAPPAAPVGAAGMERIRELARRLEKK